MITFALIFLLIISIIYNFYIVFRHKGIPESISQTSYIFNQINGKYYLFSCYCVLIVAILFPIWVDFSLDSYKFLTFLSCTGILFAGSTPLFRESYQKLVHYGSGILAIIAYILWMSLSGYYYYLLVEILTVTILSLLDKKNFVYYTEIIALLGLIILLLKEI